jgi:hypothetical protein
MNPRWQRSREARATPARTDREAFDRHVRRCGTPDLRLHLSGRQDLHLRPLDPQDCIAGVSARRDCAHSSIGGRERAPRARAGMTRGPQMVPPHRLFPLETSDPDRRRRAVGHLQHRFGVSQRRARRLARQHRSNPSAGHSGAPGRGSPAAGGAAPDRWRPSPMGVADGARPAAPRPRRPVVPGQPQAGAAVVAGGRVAPAGPHPQAPPGPPRHHRAVTGRTRQAGVGAGLRSSTRPPTGGA